MLSFAGLRVIFYERNSRYEMSQMAFNCSDYL